MLSPPWNFYISEPMERAFYNHLDCGPQLAYL